MTRRDILWHARFLCLPLLGIVALVGFPLGFLVGLIHPPWGEAIWDSLNDLLDWLLL